MPVAPSIATSSLSFIFVRYVGYLCSFYCAVFEKSLQVDIFEIEYNLEVIVIFVVIYNFQSRFIFIFFLMNFLKFGAKHELGRVVSLSFRAVHTPIEQEQFKGRSNHLSEALESKGLSPLIDALEVGDEVELEDRTGALRLQHCGGQHFLSGSVAGWC